MLQVPVLIYLPDIVPGRAIRALGKFAAKIAVTSEESLSYFGGADTVVTGYPVRSGVFSLDRVQAQKELDLDPKLDTLLVFGGSRGAHSINKALVDGLGRLLGRCQIVHISGQHDADWVAQATADMPEEMKQRYRLHDYLHNMPMALVASDLVVARAGAATMGEFPAAGLPAILVPYPHSGQHQNPNAAHMAHHGAARVLEDSELGERLVATVLGLLDDRQALARMRAAATALAKPDAAKALACELQKLSRPQIQQISEVKL
jgi:UDP-N-acetylglucosamine--N-acetylmuramyl-(pentapeptide) pyrophosphoryl-undecaprenol N-acetylglucosamine transferase